MTHAFLKITATPPGEAPQWVREAWVGLALPLAQSCTHAHTLPTFGVLTHPKNWFTQSVSRFFGGARREAGYVVECATAIEILDRIRPDAAGWWREHTPTLLQPGKCFLFQEGIGYVEDDTDKFIQTEAASGPA